MKNTVEQKNQWVLFTGELEPDFKTREITPYKWYQILDIMVDPEQEFYPLRETEYLIIEDDNGELTFVCAGNALII